VAELVDGLDPGELDGDGVGVDGAEVDDDCPPDAEE
jgi:hypothetical protein